MHSFRIHHWEIRVKTHSPSPVLYCTLIILPVSLLMNSTGITMGGSDVSTGSSEGTEDIMLSLYTTSSMDALALCAIKALR